MREYVSKPFVIQAVQWEPGIECEHVCNDGCDVVITHDGCDGTDPEPHVHTKEGTIQFVGPGDFVVKNQDRVFVLPAEQFHEAYAMR